MRPPPYPFSAIVGQPDLQLGLILNVLDPVIGGVLVRGEKGTAKSTAVRALAALLPQIPVVAGCAFNCDPSSPDPGCPAGPHPPGAHRQLRRVPLVELPVGASAERVTGTLDIEQALAAGRMRFEPGLLAAAHRGILYADEVNLLGDHIVDVLLDAAALGMNYVERDGISESHRSRFLLAGTMNPEEGELRPQLLDRFGITVEVRGNAARDERAEVVRRRLAYESDPWSFAASWASGDLALAGRIEDASRRLPSVRLSEEMLARLVSVCASFGVDGLRADIACARVASAIAAWEGRPEVVVDDVRRAALLALPHRRRRGPMDEPGLDAQALEDALSKDPEKDPPPPRGPERGPGGNGRPGPPPPEASGEPEEAVLAPGPPPPPLPLSAPGLGTGSPGRRSRALSREGIRVGDRPAGRSDSDLSLPATLRAAARRQAERGRRGGRLVLAAADLRASVREGRESNLILFVVDASGSMAARRRMSATKGAILSLLQDAYRRRDRVGMIAFRGEGARVVLAPTGGIQAATARIASLATGGRTPLAAGLECAARIAAAEALRDRSRRPLVVVLTDGRANAGGPDPIGAALAAAAHLARRGIPGAVIDTEDGPVRLGLAALVAGAMGSPCIRLDEISALPLAAAVRSLIPPGTRRSA